jgi:cell wall-associated NlpC family hydrolase
VHGPENAGGSMIRDLIGVKYKPHGRTVEEGLDCYGLAILVLGREGVKLPDVFYTDTEQDTNIETMKILEEGIPHVKLDKPEKNCIIKLTICGQPSHIGVYLGDGEFIHTTKYGVVIEPLWRWKHRVKGYYRVSN